MATVIPFRPRQPPVAKRLDTLCYADMQLVRKARLVMKSRTPIDGMSLVQADAVLRLEIARIANGGTPIPDYDNILQLS